MVEERAGMNMTPVLSGTRTETAAHTPVPSPEVRDLIEVLLRQHAEAKAILAELEEKDADKRAVEKEISTLRTRVAEREAALAISGEPIPEMPFVEDTQLAHAERQRRVRALRADMTRERLKTSQAEIQRLKGEIDAAWLAFGKEAYRKALVDFGEVALQLKERFCDVWVLSSKFPSLRLSIPEVAVGDTHTYGAFINGRDPVWCHRNPCEKRDLHVALTAAACEMERAKAGR
jgi:hypothetical protein